MSKEFLRIISLSVFVFIGFLESVKGAPVYPRCAVLKQEFDKPENKFMACETICKRLMGPLTDGYLPYTSPYCEKTASDPRYQNSKEECKADFYNVIIEFAKSNNECVN